MLTLRAISICDRVRANWESGSGVTPAPISWQPKRSRSQGMAAKQGFHQGAGKLAVNRVSKRVILVLFLLTSVQTCLAQTSGAGRPADQNGLGLPGIPELPAVWRIQFWKSSGAQALYRLSFEQVAELVP